MITVSDIARRLAAPIDGSAELELSEVAALEDAGPNSLSWLGSPRFEKAFLASRAGAVLTPPGVASIPGRTLIRVADPDLALTSVLPLFAPPLQRVPVGIHASAVVAADAQVEGVAVGPHVVIGPGACIAAGTQLHAGVYVGSDARIGRDCVLWPNVVVRERCRLGDRVIVHPCTTIGADGFGYLFRGGQHVKVPQVGIVVIEDDVEIGANCAIDRAKCGVTRVRAGVKIDNLVQIGHNCDIGAGCVLVAQVGISGSCILGQGVVMGGQAGIADHVRLGDGVQVAAKSGVQRDVPPGQVLRGIPAIEMRRYHREVAAVGRLPELLDQVRELLKRVRELEAANNRQGG